MSSSVVRRDTVTNGFRNVLKYRQMILALAARDLQSRYAGTFGGVIWARTCRIRCSPACCWCRS